MEAASHGRHFGLISAAGDEGIGVAANGQHLDDVLPNPVPHVDVPDPVGGDQDERQLVEYLPMVGDEPIGYQPGHRQEAVALWVKDDLGGVAPVTHPDDHVRPEPPVVPLLLLRRVQVDGPDFHPRLQQSPIEQVALGGEPPR